MSILQVGSSVLAILPSDGVLYRAEIVQLNQPGGHLVQYIDYGDTGVIAPAKIFPVERKFRALPRQAILCGLRDVKPASGSSWHVTPETTAGIFNPEEKFECVFHERRRDDDDGFLVSLTCKNVDVGRALVDKGWAVYPGVGEPKSAVNNGLC